MMLSIRWKVALGILLALTVGMAVAGLLALRSIEQLELTRAEEALTARTGLAALSLQPLLADPKTSPARLQTMAKELGRQADARVTVIDDTGRVLADSSVADDAVARVENHRARPEVARALADGRGTDIRTSDTTGQRLFYMAVTMGRGDAGPPRIVRLALPLTLLESRLHDFQRALLLAFGAAFVIAVLVGVLIARSLTHPLLDIAGVARQLAQGTFGQRIHTTSRDEVGQLAATLNQMADRVDQDFAALRRLENVRKDFVANVSHELRTPLTSIKGYVEALLDGAKDNPEETARFLQIILKQSDRLNLILEDLLQLSQIESGRVQFKRDPVSLRAIAERTLASLKPQIERKGHTVTMAVPNDLPPAAGDEDRLVQVMTNLLDNAVKYTPDRGSIRIDGHRVDGGWVELSVADSGLGIPDADRPRVFERFYRVDKARSRELGGTGLGLSIVKHIIEGHGGQVWAEGNQPTGSRFVFRLPVATGTPAVDQLSFEITA
jgi:signal transduction histidine kinase